jgi:hypothetical protein
MPTPKLPVCDITLPNQAFFRIQKPIVTCDIVETQRLTAKAINVVVLKRYTNFGEKNI